MSTGIFTEWLRHQGHQVFQTKSSFWVDAGPRIYQAFPYNQLITPSDEEINQFLRQQRALALRYSTPLAAKTGAASYHVILDEPEYRLEMLPKKARYDVRKGLREAQIESVSFTRMANEGWQLRLETLQRQGREKAETQAWWQKLCLSADGLSGFEAWAALIEDQMVASLIAFTCDDTCSILYQQSSTEHLSLGVNNALAFEFSREALSRPQTKRIFYGLHSLDAPPSVDQFKFRMRFVAKPVRQRVVFHPLLAPFFNNPTHALLRGLLRLRPGNPTLSKAEGMVRFYLQGQLPLSEQEWPPVLGKRD